MNVKRLLILFAFSAILVKNQDSDEDDAGLNIEVTFGNPYKEELDEIHTELLEVYDVVRDCVNHYLLDVPLASGAEIETDCVGPNFNIVNHIFLLKTKK